MPQLQLRSDVRSFAISKSMPWKRSVQVLIGILHCCQKNLMGFFPDFPVSSSDDGSQVTIAPNQITFSSMLPMIPSYNWPLVLDLCSLSLRDIGMDRVSFDAAIRTWGRGQDGKFGNFGDESLEGIGRY